MTDTATDDGLTLAKPRMSVSATSTALPTKGQTSPAVDTPARSVRGTFGRRYAGVEQQRVAPAAAQG